MGEVGAYWRMISSGIESPGGPGPAVAHWSKTFGLFSKHVQDEIATADDAAWLLELLVLDQAHEVARKAIDGHAPLPFADGVAEELDRLERRARAAAPSSLG